MNEKKIIPSKTAIPVILASYIILIVMEYLNGGPEDFNWFGIAFLGVFAFLGILRIGVFGAVVIHETTLVYHNWLFQRREIDISDIKKIEIKGLWFNNLKLLCSSKKKDIHRELLLGIFTAKQLIFLIEGIKKRNSSVSLGERLKKMLSKSPA